MNTFSRSPVISPGTLVMGIHPDLTEEGRSSVLMHVEHLHKPTFGNTCYEASIYNALYYDPGCRLVNTYNIQ